MLPPFLPLTRLESQLMSDIHTILQLLQRQPTPGPPAYSTVTSSPDYHRPAVKVQPVSLITSHLFSQAAVQVSWDGAVNTVETSDECKATAMFHLDRAGGAIVARK